MNPRIHWIRILIAGLLAEAAVFAAVIPLAMAAGQQTLLYTALAASFVMCFLAALWLLRPIESRWVLHGALIGVVAALIYVALDRARPEPAAYLAAHALKILGGALGGLTAARRRPARADMMSR